MKRLVLNQTDQSIKAVLAGAVSANQPHFVVSYAETNSSSFVEAPSYGVFNDTTAVVLLGSPASGKQRIIASIGIYNRDTAAVTITLKFVSVADGTFEIWKRTVQAGELVTLDGVFDTSGSLKTSVPTIATTALTGLLQAAQMPALTGDVTTPGGSLAATLATVNSNVGSFALATLTVDAKGRITAASAASTTGSGNVVLATSPTIVTPTVASLTNMQHDHSNAAGGGNIPGASIGSGTVAAARLGSSPSALKVLHGDNTWVQPGTYTIYPRTASGADGTSIVIPTFGTSWAELILIVEGRSDYGTGTIDNLILQMLSDTTAANYQNGYYSISNTTFTGSEAIGSVAGILVALSLPCNTAPAGFGFIEIHISNPASTSQYRNIWWVGGAYRAASTGNQSIIGGSGVWKNTSTALTQMTLKPSLGTNLKQGTAYTLLGVAA